MNFDDWAEQENLSAYGKACSRAAWQAAQEAERERTIGIILKHVDSSMRPWNECVTGAINEITGVRNGSELDT